eukprot:441401-Pelagomonas_calceolata.AAC.3
MLIKEKSMPARRLHVRAQLLQDAGVKQQQGIGGKGVGQGEYLWGEHSVEQKIKRTTPAEKAI